MDNNKLHEYRNKVMEHICCITLTTDKQMILLHLKGIKIINIELCKETGTKPADVDKLIREGYGPYRDIQQKCIEAGVV